MVPLAGDFANGGVPFWFPERPEPSPHLSGAVAADVCVVGAGFTGLWTAYYLKRAQPDLRVVVLEKESAGFGASGSNGGQILGDLPGDRERYARRHGRAATVALQRAMFGAVGEIVRVAAREGVEASLIRGGVLHLARNPAQMSRLRHRVASSRSWGWTEDDLTLLGAADHRERLRFDRAAGAAWSPHGARVQPADLVRGLVGAVRALGVEVYERTPVLRVRPRSPVAPAAATTSYGSVGAEYVILATEGFTAALEEHRRELLPLTGSLIVTTPLGPDVWDRVGWDGRELVTDLAHAPVHAQRTADDRVVLGGRGAAYRFASRLDPGGAVPPDVLAALWSALADLFPPVTGARVAHAWTGIMGVPRDGCASVRLDHRTGLGHAGGFAGHGLAAANLAGRTLRDLLLRRDTELAALPWTDGPDRRWELEPLRWLGVRSVRGLLRAADAREDASSSPRTSVLARAAGRVAGT
ncbi:NAD(P)/FAD-dependent oxidoreductase [Spirillospora sp. CA-294931]|uniref:NAD(P)/FAD-dependent oxidoreductase n=1 Tax=Spirillospora sp. CA-294931 TaxID=3240042 RepID=UPI003D9200B0